MRLLQQYAALWEPLAATAGRWLLPPLDLATYDGILLVGNQKTGSTAVAHLLAHYGGLGIAPHIRTAWTPAIVRVDTAAKGAEFVQKSRYYWRAPLVKENQLTFVLDALLAVMPRVRVVFLMRAPAQNIRSILDRVGLPGETQALATMPGVPAGWQMVVDNGWLGLAATDTIGSLAQRWALVAQIYQRHQARVQLLWYEDFLADKVGTITALGDSLGVTAVADIAPLVDKQFQPRGKHRQVAVESFFSEASLATIETVCGPLWRTIRGQDE